MAAPHVADIQGNFNLDGPPVYIAYIHRVYIVLSTHPVCVGVTFV